MRMFRSMRNPVTKTGRTSNTTGSRIRTSARTIREKTGNLVQNARKKVSMSSPVLGYKHATSPRSVPGSAAAAGEKARKKSYGQGQTTKQGRSAAYSAIKTAKAPSDAPLGYKAGYAVGARVAGSTYKQNILTKTGTSRPYSHIQGGSYQVATGRTGLESRVQTAKRAAGIQTRRFAGNLLRNKPVQPAHIQRPVSNAPLVDRNRARMAIRGMLSSAKAVVTAPFDYRRGFKLATAGRNTPGSQMSLYQSHYKTENAYYKEVRKRELNRYGKTYYPSRWEGGYDGVRQSAFWSLYDKEQYPDGSKAFKAGYEVGAIEVRNNLEYGSFSGKLRDKVKQERMKLSKQGRLQPSMLSRFTEGVRAGYRMPDASVRQTYNAQRFSASASFPGHAPVALASRGKAGSFAAGYGVGKLAKRAVQAPGKAYSTGQKVTFGIQDALSGTARGFKYAAQGNLQTARYATMNAANAVYRGDSRADRLASHIVNPIERGMQRIAPVATRIGKLNARVVEAAVPGFTSNPLSATARRIAQPVRYAMRKANERSARIAAEAARQQRIQTATPWGPKGSVTPTGKNAVVMLHRKAYKIRPNISAQPAQPQAKTPWGGRSVNWASYQPQAATPPVTPPAQPRGTGKKRGPRMPSAGQYRSGVTPGQQHPLRNKGAAQATQAAATPVPPAPPMTRQEKLDRIVAMRKRVNTVIDEEHKKPISSLGRITQANRDYYEKMGKRFRRVPPLSPPQQAPPSQPASPTTGNQASLLPEEPQPRKRGQRGPDRNPRKPRGK